MKRFLIALAGAVLFSGCDGSTGLPATPSVPGPTAPAPPAVTRGGTLSGVVYEVTPTGEVPLEDVHVYWSEYKGVDTNGKGEYSITDVFAGVQPIWVGKEGYKFAINPLYPADGYWTQVLVDGDTRFDIRLVRR